MKKDTLLSRAEENLPEREHDHVGHETGKSFPVKPVIAGVLFLILLGSGWNAWRQIEEMNRPPDVPEEVMLENMGGYMFITVSKLNAWIDREGGVPETELDFLGWDDPSIEYARLGGGAYSVSVVGEDTTLVWHSGDDVSLFLTEGALERMGIAD